MRWWWVFSLAALFASPASIAQPSKATPPPTLPAGLGLFDDELLATSIDEIKQMEWRAVEAFARALADCRIGGVSQNDLIAAQCDRSAYYFEVLEKDSYSATTKLLIALRAQWMLVRISERLNPKGNDESLNRGFIRAAQIETKWESEVSSRVSALELSDYAKRLAPDKR